MSEEIKKSNLGSVLKEILKEQSLSMRKLSELTEIDTATISRIINGKRKANPEHLQKFAKSLGVPTAELFVAAGYDIEQKPKQEKLHSDIHISVDSIQNFLESSNINIENFTITSVEQKLANYEQYVQTEEGKETILTSFGEKLQRVGSIGPFINHLKDMFEKFRLMKGTPGELFLIGSALLYFILSVDVIPDYLFPIGYLDDAIAVQLVTHALSIKE
ncbi:helix-turn-helix domain-containing protein [Peribacillus loiseleuriae]|uniref:DNA-binding protein n=1 Tax=Peribacillus loiseleuriae TaxID=1679170 RepID=A0A0K9GXT0_9BACI|nr:helix-turn-helix domain-containing protein [Peribacillus loiseleuriae]KMY51426.1 DNA-binding protein [Peribacillus loiseleuriae]